MSDISGKELRGQCLHQLEARASAVPALKAFVGLDGFVDEIIHIVDKRHHRGSFTRIATIADFAERIQEASGRSTNMELVTERVKLGGNGPIMANALAQSGIQVTYLGALGYPNLHPVFQTLADKAKVISIAEAAHTDAFEFQDGKLLMGKLTPLDEVTWETIKKRMGQEAFEGHLFGSDLVAFVNWTMVPYMSVIWESIQAEILSHRPTQGKGKIFFDLCDPQKRDNQDILYALELIGRFQSHFEVILGLNEKECLEIAEVFGIPPKAGTEADLMATVREIHSKMNVDTLVVHPVRYAVVSDRQEVVSAQGLFVPNPVITTGAGDHFNAGFCLGKLLGLSNQEALVAGVGTSGFYVGSGKSPQMEDLQALLRDWPS